MGATYTRQSSYTDGDVITAAHTNDEFNQLLAAFQASTGHTHDGTANEGGPITKLLGTAITIGDGTAGTDIAVTFDGETADGELKWMEDEDYFEFSDDILIASTEKLQFRDTAIYINSSTDGQLDLVADGAVLVDTAGDITLDADGGDIVLKDGGTQFASLTNTSGNLIIKSGSTTAVTFSGANTTFAGTVTIGSAVISEAELEVLDGATLTTAELNILDGDTSATSTTVADADRVVFNDAGTMKQVAVTDLAAYFDDEITAMPNLTSVGTLTTLTVDNIIINGTTIGHTSDTDAITIASGGDVTLSQNLTVTGDLTVSGDDITMGTNTAGNLLVADGTNFNSIAVGDLSEISTVASDDVLLAVDTSGGGLKKITRATLTAGIVSGSEISNVAEDTSPQLGGNLDMNGNDIVTTSNADIDLAPNGTGKVVVKGNTNPGTIVFNCESNSHGQTVKSQPHSASVTNVLTLPPGGDQEIVGTTATQTLTNKTLTSPVIATVTGSTITLDSAGDVTLDAGGADVVLKDDGTTYGSLTNSSGELVIKSGSTPTAAMTFSGANVTLEGNLTVSGTTTTVNSATVNLNDHNIVLDSGNSTSAVVNGAGITIEGGSGDDATFSYNTTGPKFELKLGSSHEDLQVDQLIAASLDISGNVDVDGTLETDALSIDGTSITSTAAELNILDGVTSTASELNLVDGSSAGTIVNSKGVIYGSSGEVNATTLQIAGTSITSTAAELNILDGVTSTATELNVMDGDTTASSITLADADRLVTNDGGTMKQVALSTLTTYLTSAGFSSEDPTALAIALG